MTERFSASAAPRLMQCAASGNLDVTIPGWVAPVVDHSAGAKGKGTELHKVLESAMQFGARDLTHIVAALEYVDALRSRRRFKVLTEHTMSAVWLGVPDPPKTTVDLILYVQDEIHIVDYKTGKIPVDVFENEQLMYYAACAAMTLAPQAKGVHLHIVQPWAGNGAGEHWFCDSNKLNKFIIDARAAHQRVLNKSPQFQPGHHCTFCPANPHGRGDKAKPYCPAKVELLYPSIADEDEIFAM